MIPCDHHFPYLEYHRFADDQVTSLRPRVPRQFSSAETDGALGELYSLFVAQTLQQPPVAWYYTAAMRSFTTDEPVATLVYDCMDELSAFAHADPRLVEQEAKLLHQANVVFTGGRSLYEAKRRLNGNVHAFPSAVDCEHFAAARRQARSPAELVAGYYGVIDERLDLALLAQVAQAMPDWHFEMVGPVVKIDPASLPKQANISWLGASDYADLPDILGRWNVALMPFALNDATRFISPTKTPEYLAGGRPVVSTAIADVIADWSDVSGVWIARDGDMFANAVAEAANLPARGAWLDEVDARLATISWDHTQAEMERLVEATLGAGARQAATPAPRDRTGAIA